MQYKRLAARTVRNWWFEQPGKSFCYFRGLVVGGGIFCGLSGGDLPNNKWGQSFEAAVCSEGSRRAKVTFEG